MAGRDHANPDGNENANPPHWMLCSAGGILILGLTLLLLVAVGSRATAQVPDVANRTLDQAVDILREAGFRAGFQPLEGRDPARVRIVSQQPAAGTMALSGSEVFCGWSWTTELFLPTATLTPEPTATSTNTPWPTATETPTPLPSPSPSPDQIEVMAFTSVLSTPTPLPMLTLTSVPSPTPTAGKQPVARPQWIAFETQRGPEGEYEIFVMTPDGKRLANLTNARGDDLAPAWLPDGHQIAFVSCRDVPGGRCDGGNQAIYSLGFDWVAGVAVGGGRRLTDGTASDGWPTWAPDGRYIAFHSNRGGNFDIWVLDLTDSRLIQITVHPKADRYPNWSPDGRWIAFTSKRSDNEEIWRINVADILEGKKATPIRLTDSPGRDRYPFWSPDGTQLSFSTDREGTFDIYVMNADGSRQHKVFGSDSTEGLASWSPDGQQMVFYSDVSGNKEVYVLNMITGKEINISNDPHSDEYCTWSP